MKIALRCGRIIDGTGRPPIDGAVIYVEDGLIRAIADISAVERVRFVMKQGTVHRHDAREGESGPWTFA